MQLEQQCSDGLEPSNLSEKLLSKPRVHGLDIFRSIAILLVLIGHSSQHSILPEWLAKWGALGIVGVELFFVLSGFLIGEILLKLISENKLHSVSDIAAFWKRRWLRTLPLYFLALLAFLRFDYNGRHQLIDFPYYWFFFQNFAWPIPRFFELSWSLAIEEHFYFWFPLLYLVVSKIKLKNDQTLILQVLVFLLIGWSYRLSLPFFYSWDDYNFTSRMVVLSRMDAVLIGVLMAAVKRYFGRIFLILCTLTPLWFFLNVGIVVWYYVGMPGVIESRQIQLWSPTVQAVCFSLMLPIANSITGEPQTIMARFISMTSRLSYSLYLGHILVIILVQHVLLYFKIYDLIYPNPWALFPLLFMGYYLLAWITYWLIEKVFLDLRDSNIEFKAVLQRITPAVIAVGFLVVFC